MRNETKLYLFTDNKNVCIYVENPKESMKTTTANKTIHKNRLFLYTFNKCTKLRQHNSIDNNINNNQYLGIY